MTDWAALTDAYGSAVEVPKLLAAAGDDPSDRAVWDELWGRLCHQGTVSTASYAAIPQLARIAAQRAPAGYVEPLHLVTAILASTDGPSDPGVRERFAAEIATLRGLAERNLAHAKDDGEFVYGLQALMSLDDVPIWQRELEGIADGELEIGCPRCGDPFYVVLDAEALVATSDPDGERTPSTGLVPRALESLSADERRLHELAAASGHDTVAQLFLYAAGDAVCPSCGHVVRIPEALATDR